MIEQIFNDFVLLKPIEEERISEGGIYIPDIVDNKKNYSKGIVVKTGEGIYDDLTGIFKPINVRVGDTVMYETNCLIHKSDEWVGLYLISEKDIITVIK